ncbi:MAG: DUF3995 domain-containing protein [Saprospiraceae bacterium]|nr:DUF3995 domain-containing protein [Saprospiraceae bacterium]
MLSLIGITLTGIFVFLSSIHFYWGIRGMNPGSKVIPSDSGGKLLFIPSRFDSLVVGAGLAAFSFLVLIKSNWINFSLPSLIVEIGVWVVAGLFLLRAIGDFKYVGITKKIKNTAFARMDNQYYTPLCIIIALMASLLNLMD